MPIAANRIASIAGIYPLSGLGTKDRNKRVESLVGGGQFVIGSLIMSMLRQRGTATISNFDHKAGSLDFRRCLRGY